MSRIVRVLCVAGLAALAAACGTSGTNPPERPEVYFQVIGVASGTTPFTVDQLSAGAVDHQNVTTLTFMAGTTVILENGDPPYTGVFDFSKDVMPLPSTLTVVGTVMHSPGTGDIVVQKAPVDGKVTITIPEGTPVPTPGVTPSPPVTPMAVKPEVRIEVCAPLADGTPCSITGEVPVPGASVEYTGELGDATVTHVLGFPASSTGMQQIPTTPAVYLLDGAIDVVEGVFNAVNPNQVLTVRLFFNGQLVQAVQGVNETLVLRQDF